MRNFAGRLEGRYQLTPGLIFTVRDRDGHLMVDSTGQPTQEVFPDSPTRWSYRGVDATLEFKLEKTGPATSLVLHQKPRPLTGLRRNPSRNQRRLRSWIGRPAIDAKLRRRLEGRYQLTPNFIFTVHDRNGHLMVGITNQADPRGLSRFSHSLVLPRRRRHTGIQAEENRSRNKPDSPSKRQEADRSPHEVSHDGFGRLPDRFAR